LERVLERRTTLHHQVRKQEEINEALTSQINKLQPLANLGLVSAMIAHEMNNILTPLGSYAELSMSNPDDIDLAKKTIQKTAINSARAAKILESMLVMAKGQTQDKNVYNLKALIEEVFTLIARDFSKDRIKVTVDAAEDLTVYAEAICIQQVLMNLILNARDAIISSGKGGGILSICGYRRDDFTVIEISDNGCGIEADNLKKIFEAFYTTKSNQQKPRDAGAGLGLAFCKKVVDDHNGNISVQSDPETTTTFKIALPDN